jgi:DNA-binding NarL/FixJ family response regulator
MIAGVSIRVAIVEDNLLVREGLAQLVSSQPAFAVTAACADLDSALSAVSSTPVDVLVTDIRMPPRNEDEGIVLANLLRESHPDVGVVVVSQHADPAYALALFEHGSAGRAYLLKERLHRVEELTAALEAVHAGDSVVDPHVVEELVRDARRRADSQLQRLTERELSVLECMAQGKNNAAIAATLFLAEHSVEKDVSAILTKLDLGSEHAVHRRVKAVLVYLAERGALAAPGSR